MTASKSTNRKSTKGSATDGTTVRPYRQSLPMLLMRARESVMSRFRPHLRSHGVTDQQWRILRVLAEQQQVELLELSARCLIRPQSLSRTVPALVDRGLVNRELHPDDGRRALVSLTPAGHELFETMADESARIYSQLEAELADAGLLDMFEKLSTLIDVLDGGESEE